MLKLFKVSKNEINLPKVVVGVGILLILIHVFSYLVPFTNNAFVATNVVPIAADVSGYITQIYVKNGQAVKAGNPLFKVYQKPYKLAYEYAKANYEQAVQQNAIAVQKNLAKPKNVKALKAKMDAALINYKLTIVRAPSDGVVDNMYISKGTTIKKHVPIFSFIDTANWWVQANFNETDLRHIRPGDEVNIILRMYYFKKVFKGRIVNTIWAADRQHTVERTQLQKITNDNEWLLIPQRLPLQIKILNPDPNYPLQPGASAYVYIKAKTHS
jgi:membrane fusion protein, multidrug efflux system